MPRQMEQDGIAASLAPADSGDLHSVKRQTLADSVYAQLKTAIMRGRLRDGMQLKQGELAATLGVSRVPVREALRRLQAEHLVVAEPFQCFVVTSLSADQVNELLELREELEVFAVKKTLESEQKQARIRAANVAARELTLDEEDESWLAADREFHRELNGATTAVAAIIEDVRERVHRYYLTSPALVKRRREVLKEHDRLIAALEGGDDAEVEDAIRVHVRGTRRHLQTMLGADLDAGPSDITSAGLG